MSNTVLFVFYFYEEGYPSGIQNKRLIEGFNNLDIQYKIIYRYSKSKNIIDATQISCAQFGLFNKVFRKYLPSLADIFSFNEILWILKAIRILRKQSNDFNYIHISSSPFLIQYIGYYFKKKYNKTWISQLIDPVLDNNYINSRRLSFSILKKIENLIVVNADLLILSNEHIFNRIKHRYSNIESKLRILPFITDASIIPVSDRNLKVTLIHAGSIYGKRNIDYLIRSLLLLKRKSDLFKNLEIFFIGNITREERQKIITNNLDETIRFIDYMSRLKLYSFIGKADGLLIIEALGSESVFFPSKLCEYFSFQRIIFAITPKASITSDLLSEAGHLFFSEGEEELLSDSLLNILKNPEYYKTAFDRKYFNFFLPQEVSKNYFKILNALQ